MTTITEPALLDVRDVAAMGYGHPQTIKSRIRRGEIPALMVGAKYKIDRADLHLLGKRVGAPRPTDSTEQTSDDLDALASRVVASWPRLSPESKAELGRLLAAS